MRLFAWPYTKTISCLSPTISKRSIRRINAWLVMCVPHTFAWSQRHHTLWIKLLSHTLPF